MRIESTVIPDCYEMHPVIHTDKRGVFVKTFYEDFFAKNGLKTSFAEEYYSCSWRGVLRGLHFQAPPHDHTKLVFCVLGEVLDAVVDLRVGSPTYGKFETFRLSAQKANMIYVPQGLAHGFYVLSESAILMYKVTTIHSPEHDTGILWSSAGIPWPCLNPIMSARDSMFPPLASFVSPFKYYFGSGGE
ncbi:MAG: dTDP-4-dehydrorhamnose 3 5-epimerase [Bacillota bacterium]|nr:MAG: dTDP-4-dehydrorhamnose 3 5-epimerase [Bacillota bacterium]